MIWSLKPLDAVKVFLLIFCWLQLSSWKQNKIDQLDLKANWGDSFTPTFCIFLLIFWRSLFIYLFAIYFKFTITIYEKSHSQQKYIYTTKNSLSKWLI